MQKILISTDIKRLMKSEDNSALQKFCEDKHPADIADILSSLAPTEIWKVLSRIEDQLTAEIFSHLGDETQMKVVSSLRRSDLAHLMTNLSSDDRVDLIKKLPENKQDALLPALAHAEREDIRRLASYPEETAGSVMTSEYVALTASITAGEAIAKIRLEAPDKETIYYAYVTDSKRRLLGFVSLKDLILAKPTTLIKDIMETDVIFANVSDDQEDAARKIGKYDLIALPVVNGNNTLVGIITHDDALDILNQEYTEDMEKFMAIAGKHEAGTYLSTPTLVHYKNRAIWIVTLAAIGLISGIIVHSFSGTLMQLMILALYMPMIADTGGNCGSQAATVIIRALAIKEISTKDAFKVFFKEIKIALLISITLGLLGFGKVLLLSGSKDAPVGYSLKTIAFAIALAMSVQVISATIIGAMLPIFVTKMKLDPAIVASPALTTIVDIIGLTIYFTTAKLMLGI
jgi:magnesium transporter